MMDDLSAELDAIPAQMAAAVVAWLPQTTLDGYKAFLDVMYHYTRSSQARLLAAADAATDEPLRAFLLELADDEAHHYRLAQADLAAFGLAPSADKPESVAAFEAMWAALPADGAAAYLGALVALEGVADHAGADAVAMLTRLGLGKREARFILVHVEADAEHGGLCRAHALRIGQRAPDAVLRGAQAAGDAWVAMHQCLMR